MWQRFRFLIAKEFDGYLKLNAYSAVVYCILQIGITKGRTIERRTIGNKIRKKSPEIPQKIPR